MAVSVECVHQRDCAEAEYRIGNEHGPICSNGACARDAQHKAKSVAEPLTTKLCFESFFPRLSGLPFLGRRSTWF
ncbi:MAG: hypothetical protein DCC68_19330 [Planctomycetota bacterium]|nr:MAG: hypothetical protein DCC68_19330 [Planctomycetota bacterium]